MNREAEKQEPDDLTIAYLSGLHRGKELAVQPKREWVGLTHEEIDEISVGKENTIFSFARAIEAKLKEKNA